MIEQCIAALHRVRNSAGSRRTSKSRAETILHGPLQAPTGMGRC